MADSVLEVQPVGSESSSADSPILRPRKRARNSWLEVSELLEIFPDATPTTLCALAEASDRKPSAILKIVPRITSRQLADFGALVKASRRKKLRLGELDSSSLLEEIKEEVDNRHSFSVSICVLVVLWLICG